MAKTLDCGGRSVEAATPAELVQLWCAGCREVVDGVPVPTDPTDLTGITAEAPAPVAPEQPASAPVDVAPESEPDKEPQA